MFGYLEEVEAIFRIPWMRGAIRANCFDPYRDQKSFQNIFSVEPAQNLVGPVFPEGTSFLNLF